MKGQMHEPTFTLTPPLRFLQGST